jgi:hypothetical protein
MDLSAVTNFSKLTSGAVESLGSAGIDIVGVREIKLRIMDDSRNNWRSANLEIKCWSCLNVVEMGIS